MKFYTKQDLCTDSKDLWQDLSTEGEITITEDGRPSALMIKVSEENYKDMLQAFRQAKASVAFNDMRKAAASKGFLSDDEIEAEIDAARNGD